MKSKKPIIVSFKSEVNSNRKTKMEISFEEAKDKPSGGKDASTPKVIKILQ